MPLDEIVHHATSRKKVLAFCRRREKPRKPLTPTRTVYQVSVVSATRPRRGETRRVAGNELREMIDCISAVCICARRIARRTPAPPHLNPVVFQPTATRCYYSRCCLISGFVTDCTVASRRAAPRRAVPCRLKSRDSRGEKARGTAWLSIDRLGRCAAWRYRALIRRE